VEIHCGTLAVKFAFKIAHIWSRVVFVVKLSVEMINRSRCYPQCLCCRFVRSVSNIFNQPIDSVGASLHHHPKHRDFVTPCEVAIIDILGDLVVTFDEVGEDVNCVIMAAFDFQGEVLHFRDMRIHSSNEPVNTALTQCCE